jgi:hypothetical protein
MPWCEMELRRAEGVAAGLNASNKTSENGGTHNQTASSLNGTSSQFYMSHWDLQTGFKDTIDYADLVAERTPQVLKDTRQQQIAEHNHDRCKQDISDWEFKMVRL